MVRVNLRLPGNLKAMIEDPAAAWALRQTAESPRSPSAGQRGPGRLSMRTTYARDPDWIVGDSHRGWTR